MSLPINSIYSGARVIFVIILASLMAACDIPIGTDQPIAFGSPVTEADAAQLLGDYTRETDGEPEKIKITWRNDSGSENITDRGSLRIQMRIQPSNTLKYDVSLFLSRLPDTEGLYSASLDPTRSIVYETEGEHAGKFRRVQFPLMFLLLVDDNHMRAWGVFDTEDAATRLVDIVPPAQQRHIFDGRTDPAIVLPPDEMRRALIANNVRVRAGTSPMRLERYDSAKACTANWIDWSNAAADEPGANARLAEWYADSIAQCPQNCGEAVSYTAVESLRGNPSAMRRLSAWRENNTCDISTGNNPLLRDLLKRAKAGDVSAMFSLARMYEIDTGIVPVSYEQSIRWYLAAAEAGDKDAQFTVGKMYHYGVGAPGEPTLVQRNAATAGYWYDRAAAAGHLGAVSARREISEPPARSDFQAVDSLAAVGALVVTYCVLNPEDCFGAANQPVQPSAVGQGGNSCTARIASGLMRCQSHVDFSSCGPGGCNDYWECNRVVRYIKNDKPRYSTKRADVRTFGVCRRPGSSGRTDNELYCDPETGEQATTYDAMVAKACR